LTLIAHLSVRRSFSDPPGVAPASGWEFQPPLLMLAGRNFQVGSRLLARMVRIAHPPKASSPDEQLWPNRWAAVSWHARILRV